MQRGHGATDVEGWLEGHHWPRNEGHTADATKYRPWFGKSWRRDCNARSQAASLHEKHLLSISATTHHHQYQHDDLPTQCPPSMRVLVLAYSQHILNDCRSLLGDYRKYTLLLPHGLSIVVGASVVIITCFTASAEHGNAFVISWLHISWRSRR